MNDSARVDSAGDFLGHLHVGAAGDGDVGAGICSWWCCLPPSRG